MDPRGVNMVQGGGCGAGSPRGRPAAWRRGLGLMHGLLPSHRSDKNGVSEDCGPGEEEQDPALCVLR